MTEEAGDVGPLAPSTNGHKTAGTNGRKTVPTEVPELTVEQAATGHNGIIGEHGHQVESPRERWRRERREEIAINDPQLFYAMPEEDRRQLLAWVRENLAARRGKQVRNSYWLKHEAEHRLGFYVGNGELKSAMLEAGHRPVWDNRINMGFCCAAKPGSPWGKELREEAEARREIWQPQPGPEEILRELFQQIASGEGEAA